VQKLPTITIHPFLIRQEARHLLLTEAAGAADVAFRVGYESPSQFSREYSRLFGLPPKEDIKHLKESYDQRINA
jgi:transcriptional regulator GlxA family with amidase domain